MTPEDTAIRNEFKEEMQGKVCEWCGKRRGLYPHEIFRRKKGLVVFMLWVCSVCHTGGGMFSLHGDHEALLRPIQCKVMLKHRPDLKAELLEKVLAMREYIK